MAECSFVDRRGSTVFSAGSPSAGTASAGGFADDCGVPRTPGVAAASGRGLAGSPFAAGGAAPPRHANMSGVRRFCQGLGRSVAACFCCCGLGSRLLQRLLWVPSSLFLPLEAQAGAEDPQRSDEDDTAYGLSMRYRSPGFGSPSSLSSTSAAAAAAARARAAAAEKIWKSYFFGQLANVAKAAVWWSTFGVLVLALAGPAATGTAVGLTRAAFNLALVLASPVAGAFVERRSIRGLLATTTATRLLIWSVAVPAAAWFALSSSSSLHSGSRVAVVPYPQQQQHSWEEDQVVLLQHQQRHHPQVVHGGQPPWEKDGRARAPRQQFEEEHHLPKHQRLQQQGSAVNRVEPHTQGSGSGAAADSGGYPTDNVHVPHTAAVEQKFDESSSRSDSRGTEGSSDSRISSNEDTESSNSSSGSGERVWGFTKKEEKEEDGDAVKRKAEVTFFPGLHGRKVERTAAGEKGAKEEEAREASLAGTPQTAFEEELRAAAQEENWFVQGAEWLQEDARKAGAAPVHTKIAAEAEGWSRDAEGPLLPGEKAAGGRGLQQQREAYTTEQALLSGRRLAADGDAAEEAKAATAVQQHRLPTTAVAPANDLSVSSRARELTRDSLTQRTASSFASASGATSTDAEVQISAGIDHTADMTDPVGTIASSTAIRTSVERGDVASSSSTESLAPFYIAGADGGAAGAVVSASFAPSVRPVAAPADAAAFHATASRSSAASLPDSTAAATSPAASPAAAGAPPTFVRGWAPLWDPPLGAYMGWGAERMSFLEVAAAGAHAAAASAAAATRAAGAALAATAAPVWRWLSLQTASVGRGLTQEQLLWVLVALMFVDGLQVAFANAVDIDCGGLETLGLQYDLPLSEEVRTALNTRHQFVFDFSFIFFTPPVACLVCLVSRLMHGPLFSPDAGSGPFHQLGVLQAAQQSPATATGGPWSRLESSWGSAAAEDRTGVPNERVTEVFPLLLCMSAVFGGLSLLSVVFYCCGLPRKTVQEEQQQQEQRAAAGGGAAGREQRGTYYEEEEEEQQQKLQLRQQQRWDFFGSPVNNAVGGAGPGGAEGRGAAGGGWEGSSGSDACDDDGNNSDLRSAFSSSSVQTVSLFQETVARLEDLREGLAIVLREKALGWRLIFLALETALEDSMVSVVVPQIALTHFSSGSSSSPGSDASSSNGYTGGRSSSSVVGRAAGGTGDAVGAGGEAFGGPRMVYGSTSAGGMGGEDSTRGGTNDWADWLGGRVSAANLFAVCVIAVGKVGGCLAGIYMNRHWVPPPSRSRGSSYKLLFWSVFGSSVAVLLLPLSRLLLLRQLVPQWGAVALVLFSTFSFFLFSTAPKIGFASLLQGLVSSQIVACKVFGFVGTFVTLVDACVIAAVNLLFSLFPQPDALHALAAVSAVYFVHGVVEALLGPLVILESTSSSDLLLIQRQRSNSTLGGSVAELATSPFGAAAEGRALRAVTQPSGTDAEDFDGASCRSSWGAGAGGAERARGWSPHAGPAAPRAAPLPNSAPAGPTAGPRKGRKSQENLPSDAAFAVGSRKNNSGRLPCTGNTTHVDMR